MFDARCINTGFFTLFCYDFHDKPHHINLFISLILFRRLRWAQHVGILFRLLQIFFAFFTLFVLDFLNYSFDSPFSTFVLQFTVSALLLTDQGVLHLFLFLLFFFFFGVVEDF